MTDLTISEFIALFYKNIELKYNSLKGVVSD